MNLPNKLTVARMALIPVFLVFMLAEGIPHRYLIAAVIFGAASYTDYLDGAIARRDGLVTNFGKLMDPLADKLLVFSAIICFIRIGMANELVVFIILARELLVTSVRLIAAERGTVIAADGWGKLKTIFQITWVLFSLLTLWVGELSWTVVSPSTIPRHDALVNSMRMMSTDWQVVVLAITVFSGFNYIWKSRGLFSDIR